MFWVAISPSHGNLIRGKITAHALFLLLFCNPLELRDAFPWLLLNMAVLRNGIIRSEIRSVATAFQYIWIPPFAFFGLFPVNVPKTRNLRVSLALKYFSSSALNHFSDGYLRISCNNFARFSKTVGPYMVLHDNLELTFQVVDNNGRTGNLLLTKWSHQQEQKRTGLY